MTFEVLQIKLFSYLLLRLITNNIIGHNQKKNLQNIIFNSVFILGTHFI